MFNRKHVYKKTLLKLSLNGVAMFAKGNLLTPQKKMMLWNNVSPFKSCLFWVAMLVFKGVKQINQPDPIGSLIFMVFMKVNLPWLCMDGMGMS